jgi:hypothetical protein
MSVPTPSETFVQLIEHLRKAQESAAMMSHLIHTESGLKDDMLAKGWLMIAELLRRMILKVTEMAQGRLN